MVSLHWLTLLHLKYLQQEPIQDGKKVSEVKEAPSLWMIMALNCPYQEYKVVIHMGMAYMHDKLPLPLECCDWDPTCAPIDRLTCYISSNGAKIISRGYLVDKILWFSLSDFDF